MSGYVRVMDMDAEDAEEKKDIRRLADRLIGRNLPPVGVCDGAWLFPLSIADMRAIIKAAYGNYLPKRDKEAND